MLRLTLLWGVILFGCGYALKDWFRALLLLILLMAVYQHPDMPRSIAGIPGLNPWNLLLMFVCVGWMVNRRTDGYAWDFPRGSLTLLMAYAAVLLVSSFRAIRDPNIVSLTATEYGSMGAIVGDMLVNTFKWMLLPVLVFDGCRSERRVKEALWVVLGVYVLLALQVAKYMPPQYAIDGDALQYRAIRVLEKGVGYHRVNLSVMLAGASWALFSARQLFDVRWKQWLLCATCLLIVYAQGMTAGRAGYLAWALVGLTLCVVKWRRYLLAIPIVAAAIVVFVPAVSDRMLAGFTADNVDSNAQVAAYEASQKVTRVGEEGGGIDAYTVTSGRSFMWPFVLAKIAESPLVGWGREAMIRTGITAQLWTLYGEGFPHPHNAYLQILLDCGIIGFLIVIPFYVVVTWRSLVVFRDNRSPLFVAVGGACLAVLLSLLFGAVGSQSFYPREGWVGMWCLIGLLLRIHVQRLGVGKPVPAAQTVRPARPVGRRMAPMVAAPAPAPAPATAARSLDEMLWPPPAIRNVGLVRPSHRGATGAGPRASSPAPAPRSSQAPPVTARRRAHDAAGRLA